MSKGNPHWGTTLDEFLGEEGIREAAKAETLTRLVAWQLSQEMERQGMTKAALAERMHTSRAQVDRTLKAKGNITIDGLRLKTAPPKPAPAATPPVPAVDPLAEAAIAAEERAQFLAFGETLPHDREPRPDEPGLSVIWVQKVPPRKACRITELRPSV